MAQKPGGFSAGRGLLSAAKTLNFGSGHPGSGVGRGRGHEQVGGSQASSSEHLSSTSLKLFSSLGLSPSDLDALAQIPEDQISVETLPHILRQLKNRKNPESFSDWDEPRDREDQRERDYSYRQESAQSHSFGLNFGASGDFSRRDFGMTPSSTGHMQGRVGQPSQSKVEDFVGLNPARFPHVCSLCDFDVHSILEWNQHINGLRHTENRRVLLNLYPEWEPPLASNRSGGMDTPNLSAGILGPAPMSSQASGMASGWGGGGGGGAAMSGMNQQGQAMRSRVVMVKYERKPLSNKSIFNFVEPFGQLREHLVLKNMAFLEMNSHDEALDVVNYYQQNPASLGGKPLAFELSKRLFIEKQEPSHPADRHMDRPMDRQMDRQMDRHMDRHMDRQMDRQMDRHMDQHMDRPMDSPMDRPGERPMNRGLQDINPGGSQVVYFSNLPREEDKKRDLLTIAGRFGTVEKHLFLQAEGFIQLASPRDAEMMVKYYSMNPLVVRGRKIRLNICTKYKTLNVRRPGPGQGRRSDEKGPPGGRSRPSRSSPSPRRSTNRRSSPSPKRSTGTRSPSPKRSSSKKTSPSPKTRTKEERKKEERPKSKPASKPEPKPETKPEAKPEPKEEPQKESGDGEKEESPNIQPEPESEGEAEQQKASNGDGHKEDAAPEEVGGADGQVKAESEKTDDNVADPEGSVENMESDLHEEEEEDFMENMDDMVVLDELEDEDGPEVADDSMKGGMRVVVVIGFRKGYKYIDDLMQLAKPFGKVVRHLILDLRSRAYLQFSTEEEAVAMSKFYNGNVQASVCGRPVKIYHYTAHPTIQTGRVVYIGQIPNVEYDEDDILKFVEPFGKVKKFFLHHIRKECFIEMSKSEEAEKVTDYYRTHPLMFHGKRLTTYVSRKYRELRGRHVMKAEDKKASKREKSPDPKAKSSEEPPSKRPREETSAEEASEEEGDRTEEASKEGGDEEEEAAKEGGEETKEEESEEEDHEDQGEEMLEEEEEQKEKAKEEEALEDLTEETETEDKPVEESEEEEEQDSEHEQTTIKEEEMETSLNVPSPEAPPLEPETPPTDPETTPPESKPSVASLPLPPHDPSTPLGVEHVKLGYYCRVCCLFYSNEDAAKRTHCSTKAHYDNLQKFLEKKK